MKNLELLQRLLSIWLTITILPGVGLTTKSSHAVSFSEKEKSHFQLHILKKDCFQLNLSGEPKGEWTILKKLDLSSESGFQITENDIESYNWPDQLITLTLEDSMKFLGLMRGEDIVYQFYK